MSAEHLKAILDKLPRDRHEAAKEMILTAEVAGYCGIGFWEWFEGARMSEFDLVGFDAKGNLRFLQ